MSYCRTVIVDGDSNCKVDYDFDIAIYSVDLYFGYRRSLAVSNTKKIQYEVNSWNGEKYTSSSSGYLRLNVPSNAIPNATKATLKIKIPIFCVAQPPPTESSYTVGQFVGYEEYTFTVKVPNNDTYKPSISSYSCVSSGNSTAVSWGVFVKSLSSATISFTVSPGSGSSIKSTHITTSPSYGSYSATTATSITFNTIVFGSAGTVNITIELEDRRGRKNTYHKTITVVDYSKPSISATYFRCNSSGQKNEVSGTYASVKPTFTIANVSGGGNTNTAVVHKVTLNSIDTTVTSGTTYILGGGNLSIDKSYTGVITVQDSFGQTTTYNFTISSRAYVFHVRAEGKSIGIARAAGDSDDYTIHVGWKIKMDDDIYLGASSSSTSSKRVRWTAADGTEFKLRTYNDLLQFTKISTNDSGEISCIAMRTDGSIYVSGGFEINSGNLYMRNSGGNNHIYICRGSNTNKSGEITQSTNGTYEFYAYPSENVDSNQNNRECYYLPTPDTGRTSQKDFPIWTAKNCITLGQGDNVVLTGSQIMVAYSHGSSRGGLVLYYNTNDNNAYVCKVAEVGTVDLVFENQQTTVSGDTVNKLKITNNSSTSRVYRIWYFSNV